MESAYQVKFSCFFQRMRSSVVPVGRESACPSVACGDRFVYCFTVWSVISLSRLSVFYVSMEIL